MMGGGGRRKGKRNTGKENREGYLQRGKESEYDGIKGEMEE